MKKYFYFGLLVLGGYVVYRVMKKGGNLPFDTSLLKMNQEAKEDYGVRLPEQNPRSLVIHRWGRKMTMDQYNKIKWKVSLLDDWKYTFAQSMTDEKFKELLGE